MQQKLITLAVAALASGTALAQSSNVQIYGFLDMGFSHRSDSYNPHVGSKNSLDSGITAGNRLGFKGTEDLGNGLKALFTLEAGFALDDGNHAQGGRLFGRQAFLGLTGDFGTVIAGRLYTPHYTFLSAVDPFKAGTVGRYRNVYDVGVDAGGENLLDPVRVDNTVAYVSPTFSGFNVTAAYSANAIGQENQENGHDNTVIALLPRYTNGPIDVGVSYHRIQDNDSGAGVFSLEKPKITDLTVAGTYDFKVVKLAAIYDRNKITASNNPLPNQGNNAKLKSWLIGATVPFGKHAIQVSYTQSKWDDFTDDSAGKTKQWAVGYTYDLSKRTGFYAAYADLNNDNEKGNKAGKVQRTSAIGDGSNGGTTYQSGFQFGLKHAF
ncbi:MAG: porin [Zoogloeaceae bacterium]|nr:porin [Zoogloeaceae bacterium]